MMLNVNNVVAGVKAVKTLNLIAQHVNNLHYKHKPLTVNVQKATIIILLLGHANNVIFLVDHVKIQLKIVQVVKKIANLELMIV